MGKRPTIQMVADLAGVSRGTVDRVLNGRSYVSAPVRQRVLAAIQETGYVSCREHHQQALQSAPAMLTLGVLLPNWENQFRTEVEQGIRMAQEELTDAGIRWWYADAAQICPERRWICLRNCCKKGLPEFPSAHSMIGRWRSVWRNWRMRGSPALRSILTCRTAAGSALWGRMSIRRAGWLQN